MILSKPSCSADPPHIWWCVAGPLAFLPLHAAGIYNKSAQINISEYVVSSYAPTLSAIIMAAEKPRNFQGILTVGQSNTPGQSALPSTTVELTQIQRRAHTFGEVSILDGPAASVESVINGMKAHSWVHIACHGIQDRVEPTKSALCLHDGNLELSTVINQSFPHADFAFLSACYTAAGDEAVAGEAVHLAAGLMFAGFRGVIGSMWEIQDKDALVIADKVYSDLFSDAEPDSTKAALALHNAVKFIRQQEEEPTFLSWLPFVHFGV